MSLGLAFRKLVYVPLDKKRNGKEKLFLQLKHLFNVLTKTIRMYDDINVYVFLYEPFLYFLGDNNNNWQLLRLKYDHIHQDCVKSRYEFQQEFNCCSTKIQFKTI